MLNIRRSPFSLRAMQFQMIKYRLQKFLFPIRLQGYTVTHREPWIVIQHPRYLTRRQASDRQRCRPNVTAIQYLLYDKGTCAQGGASVVAKFSKSTPDIWCFRLSYTTIYSVCQSKFIVGSQANSLHSYCDIKKGLLSPGIPSKNRDTSQINYASQFFHLFR